MSAKWKQQQGRKQPYYVSLPDEPTFGLAGLYDEFAGQDGDLIASSSPTPPTP